MTQSEILALINRRMEITRRRYIGNRLNELNRIDAKLSEAFAPGQRPDIDRLLGRKAQQAEPTHTSEFFAGLANLERGAKHA